MHRPVLVKLAHAFSSNEKLLHAATAPFIAQESSVTEQRTRTSGRSRVLIWLARSGGSRRRCEHTP